MKKELLDQDDQFEKKLDHLKEEIGHEKEEIKHLSENLEFEKRELSHLEEEVEELEKSVHSHHHHEKKVCLLFIVNGKPEKVQANENWILKKAVEIALKESGNEGRPISDWSVKRYNQVLDLNKKIEDFKFPECDCVELFLSLNAGQGGNK